MKPSKFSPVAFFLAILCFALPFVTVSCQGQPVAKLSGFQLATGTTIEQQGLFGPAQQKKVEPVGYAGFALLCAVAGLVLTLVKFRGGPFISAGLAISADGSLLLMKIVNDQQINQQGLGVVVVSYGAGFALAFLLFAVGAVLSVLQYRAQEQPPGYSAASSYAPPASGVKT